MFILRIIGLWVLILAFIALVYDGTKTMANDGNISITSVGGHWASLNESSFKFLENLVSNTLHPFVWDPLFQWAFLLPAWFAFGIIGSWLYWIGRKRKKIEIFLN